MIDIIIGRESGADAPRLAIEQNGKTLFCGKPGSVPKSVSRRHCHIIIDDNAMVTIEDITPNNILYVNGRDCKRKQGLSISDTIELGPDKYRVDLESISKVLVSMQSFSISHLKEIYDNYQKQKIDMQVKRERFSALCTIPGAISILSAAVAAFIKVDPASKGPGLDLKSILLLVAGVLMLLAIILRFGKSNYPVLIKEMDDKFREEYVCPNPLCNHFLGTVPYTELLKNKGCPYCKSKFTE